MFNGTETYAPGGYYADAQTVSFTIGDQSGFVIDPKNPSFNFDTTKLPEGNNTLTITVTTEHGQTYQQEITIFVDNQPPAIEISETIQADTAQFTLSGVVTDASDVDILTINTIANLVQADGSFDLGVTLNEGENLFTIFARDTNGHAITKQVIVTFYTAAAKLEILSPIGDQLVWASTGANMAKKSLLYTYSPKLISYAGMQNYTGLVLSADNLRDNNIPFFEFNAYAERGDGNLAVDVTYSLTKNGAAVVTNAPLAAHDGFNYLLPLTTELLGDDLHTSITGNEQFYLTIKAVKGDIERTEGFAFKLLPQTISLTSELSVNDTFTGSTADITLTSSTLAGVQTGKLTIGGIVSNSTTSPLTFSADISTLENGTHTATLELSDRNSVVFTKVMAITIDRDGPSITSTIPAHTNDITMNIAGVISDTSGLKSLTVNGQAANLNIYSGNYSITLVYPTPNGAATADFVFVATDALGNTSTTTYTVSYDAHDPEITLLSPINNQTVYIDNFGTPTLSNLSFTGSAQSIYVYNATEELDGLGLSTGALNNANVPHLHFSSLNGLPEGGNVQTSTSYSLVRNGATIKHATVITPYAGFNYILPLTTDYFGADWYTGNDSDLYVLTITSEYDGDIESASYSFKTMTATPSISNPLTASTILSGDSNTTISFNSTDVFGMTSSSLKIGVTGHVDIDWSDLSKRKSVLNFIVNPAALGDGVYDAVLTLNDRRGVAFTQNMEVTVDNAGPSFTHNMPRISKDYLYTVTGTVSDLGSGVADLTIDGETVSFNSSTGEYSHEIADDS